MHEKNPICKYSGAGNDFFIIDARNGVSLPSGAACREEFVRNLFARESPDGSLGGDCSSVGWSADGLMLLSEGDDGADFRMEFYNPDGSSGMMCGNGGRCIVAFAEDIGIKPLGEEYVFDAPDGRHRASIVSREGYVRIVRLQMREPFGFSECADGYFVNTGARHLVRFVPDVSIVDVSAEGSALRHSAEFAPEGVNVDFVQVCSDGSLRVRTFEKGVEAETLACGTGIVASAFVARTLGLVPGSVISVRARISTLSVEFSPDSIYLTGPAVRL